MEEKDLIKKIQELQQIKPREDWVVFTKNEILRETEEAIGYRERFSAILEILPRIIFQRKLAYVNLTILMVLVGIFGFAQNTMPGDLLFPLKKAAEESQKVFLSQENQSKYNLEIVSKRLGDLNNVVRNNQKKNIIAAVKEAEVSISQAAKSLISQKSVKAVQEMALQVKKLKEEEQKIASLGMEAGETEEPDNPIVLLVQHQISELERSSLTENQQTLLNWAKIDVENKDYSEALIKILQISNL